MFARPRSKSSRKVRPIGGVDQDFTKVVRPLLKKTVVFSKTDDDVPASPNIDPEVQPAPQSRRPKSAVARTGDSASYHYSQNDYYYIHKAVPKRAYRVVSYTEDSTGKISLFDILSGKPYNCGYGKSRKITSNAIVFDTKEAALSERFPHNQHCGTKSGNGVMPRVLIAFDVWGFCRKRMGGGLSSQCEYVKFMTIVKYLDAPHPTVKRLSNYYVNPHFFPGPDNTAPNRMRNSSRVKRYRAFEFYAIDGPSSTL